MLASDSFLGYTPPAFVEDVMRNAEEKEKHRKYMRVWYAANKDKVKAWARRYKLENIEKAREWNRISAAKSRAADPGKNLTDRQRYRNRDPQRYLFLHARARAKQLGLSFDLAKEDIVIPDFCPVLGIKLEWGVGQRASANHASPSLDRFDNSLGYVRGNVNVISNRANFLKNNATPEELLKVAIWVAQETKRIRGSA